MAKIRSLAPTRPYLTVERIPREHLKQLFTPGEVLHAQIAATLGEQHYLLLIRRRHLMARASRRFKAGQHIRVRVRRNHPHILLDIVAADAGETPGGGGLSGRTPWRDAIILRFCAAGGGKLQGRVLFVPSRPEHSRLQALHLLLDLPHTGRTDIRLRTEKDDLFVDIFARSGRWFGALRAGLPEMRRQLAATCPATRLLIEAKFI